MADELISIGLVTFNASSHIQIALNSVLSQTYPNVEILVVDDCSTDGTNELLRQFAATHEKVRLYSNTVNSGVAVSRNRLISEARGEFLVFFDDDDASSPDRIEQQYRRIIQYEIEFANGSPVICHSARRVVYPSGEELIHSTVGQLVGRVSPYGALFARRVLLGTPLEDAYGACPTCSQMARLSTYKMVGGFDDAFRRCEDTDFCIRAALMDTHFVGIADPLVTQFMTKTNEKSLSSEYFYNKKLLVKHRLFIESEGNYAFCIRWLDLKQFWLEGRKWKFLLLLSFLVIASPYDTISRVWNSVPNFKLNRAFSRFHR